MKKSLSAFITACVLIASPGALYCQCVEADCGFASKAVRAEVPQCHHTAAPESAGETSRKGCCGKCQIEKAEFFSREFSAVRDARYQNTLEEINAFDGFQSKSLQPSLFYKEFAESPPWFFERFILNTAFSFRAPPQG